MARYTTRLFAYLCWVLMGHAIQVKAFSEPPSANLAHCYVTLFGRPEAEQRAPARGSTLFPLGVNIRERKPGTL